MLFFAVTLVDIFFVASSTAHRQAPLIDCITPDIARKWRFQVFTLEACRCHKQIIKELMSSAKSAIKAKWKKQNCCARFVIRRETSHSSCNETLLLQTLFLPPLKTMKATNLFEVFHFGMLIFHVPTTTTEIKWRAQQSVDIAQNKKHSTESLFSRWDYFQRNEATRIIHEKLFTMVNVALST